MLRDMISNKFILIRIKEIRMYNDVNLRLYMIFIVFEEYFFCFFY